MIFNKDSKGSQELKQLIGFIFASIDFDNLKSYIDMAERDVRKIISREVFQKALDHYNSDNYQVEADEDHPEYVVLDELVSKIQYPVAINAYRNYAPSNDITHSDKGRQIFVSEEEKPAFEWQIEKDNENLLALYHKAVDILLEFLDEHIDDKVKTGDTDDETSLLPWGTTREYEATRHLFINKADDFEKYFSIHRSRLVYLALVPSITRVQDGQIRPCFTEQKYDELKEQILDNDLSDTNKGILELACSALALFSMSVAIKRLSIELLPDGIFANYTTNVIKSRAASTKVDRNEVSINLERDGMKELRKLQDLLHKLEIESSGTTETPADLADRFDPKANFARL
jgi:hypothetical protein